MTIEAAYLKHGARDRSFRLWAEEAASFEDGKPVFPDVQAVNKSDPPIMVFLKHFDAEAQSLLGVGHIYLKKQSKVADMVPMLTQMMGWKSESPDLTNGLTNGATSLPTVSLFEEIKSSMIEPMKPKSTLAQAEIQDGDIVCFQKQLPEKQVAAIASTGGYTDAREFYDYMLNRKQVHFSPKFTTENQNATFKLDLSRKMSYEQFSAKVGEYLKIDPTHIRFSTINSTTGKAKMAVKRNATNLTQILSPAFGTYGNSNQRDDALFYEILDMSLTELDTKKSLRVIYLAADLSKEEVLDILVPKMGTFRDLYAGIEKKVTLNKEMVEYLRVYEISNGKIYREYRPDTPLTAVSEHITLIAEVIPEEERNAEENDFLVSCFHFDKEAAKAYAIPFKLLVKPVSQDTCPFRMQILTCLGRDLQRD